MAKDRTGVCPGCSRHCPQNHVQCKYGRRYFEKIRETAQSGSERQTDDEKGRRKWEKHVEHGGLLWKLLWVSSRSKRALRRKELTEKECLAMLSEEERTQLNTLLGKISEGLA